MTTSRFTRAAVLVAAVGLAVTSTGTAQAATATTIRQGDLIGDTTVAGGASYRFTGDGIAIDVPDSGPSFARGVWRAGYPLAGLNTITYEWIGTNSRPGIRLDVDLDGDGKPDGQLVSEAAYGTQDVWLNRDIGDYNGLAPTLPADTFKNAAPCDANTPRSGVSDPCGSYGGQYHGTLANWATRLTAAAPAGKTPTVFSAGFGASGNPQQGVLRTVNVGTNTYTFTNQAAPTTTPTPAPKTTPTVTIKVNKSTVRPGGKAKVTGVVTGAGTGAKLTLQRKSKGGNWKDKLSVIVPTTSAYNFKVRVPFKGGKVKYRTVVGATTTTNAVISDQVKVKIKR